MTSYSKRKPHILLNGGSQLQSSVNEKRIFLRHGITKQSTGLQYSRSIKPKKEQDKNDA